jgi:hypothetical protein
MVYDSRNQWVSGLYPSSGILNTRKDDVSKGSNRIGISFLSHEDGNRPSFRNVMCFSYL